MNTLFGICAIIRDEAPSIEEWLAFHLLQGAGRILVYDNGSTDGTLDILAQAAAHAPLTVIDWSNRPGHFDTVQREAYMDGAKQLSGICDFAAFIDADEFLHGGEAETVLTILASVPPEVSAIAVNQRMFGSGGLTSFEPGLITTRFTRCNAPDFVENCWCKTIARPEQIKAFDSVHSVVLRSGKYVMNDMADVVRETDHPGQFNRVAKGKLTVNHYALRSLEEFQRKQSRWRPRSEMQERYNMRYFAGREPVANVAVDGRLLGWAEAIKQKIELLRAPVKSAPLRLSPLAAQLLQGKLIESPLTQPAAPEVSQPRRSLVSTLLSMLKWRKA